MKTGQAQEFSMDDVLESIRRIISDGETPAEADRAAADPAISRGFLEGFEQAARTVSLADPERTPAPRPAARRDTPEAPAAALRSERPAAPLAARPAPAAAVSAPAPRAARPLPPLRTTLADPVRAEPVRPEAVRPELPRVDDARAPALPAEPAVAPVASDRLLSRAAESAVESAFGSLGQAVVARQPQTTLEDLVKDLMRPMVSAWLDRNLPTLVERLVQAEIQRLSRGD